MSRGVCVLCPTRGRPASHARLLESVVLTSAARVATYIDEDEAVIYPAYGGWLVGPRVGPVASANELVKANPGFRYYGLLTDDSVLTKPGWDDWLLGLGSGLRVVSPSTTQGAHVDMPFVSEEWIARLGWYAYPGCYHTGWPTITGVVAEAAGCLIRAPQSRFFVEHRMLGSQNGDRLREDSRQLYAFFQHRFSTALASLRQT